MQKIHQRTLLSLSLMAAFLLSGCQAAPSPVGAQAQAAEAVESVPDNALSPRATAESFYEALVAEILVQEGDAGSSFELMLRSAQTRKQEELFRRSMQIAFLLGDGERALRAANAWLAAVPSSRDANKAVLQVLVSLNRIPQSQWHLRQELNVAAESEMAENLYAIPLVYQRTPDKAVVYQVVQAAMADQLKEDSPWRADALAVLGRVELQREQPDAALESLRQAYAVNPQSVGAAFLALELYAQGNPKAGAMLHAYASSDTANTLFLIAYGRLLAAQNNDQQALQVFQRVTSSTPDMPDPWLAQGALQASLEQYADAKKSLDQFDRLIDELPQSDLQLRGIDESLVIRAQIAEAEGDLALAHSLLDEVNDPGLVMRVQIQRARSKAQQGHINEARALIQALPAPNEEIKQLKQRAEVQLLRDYGDTQGAYNLLAQLIKSNPDDDDLVYEYALMAERLGKVKEMETQLRRIIDRSPGHFNALNALGYSYADRGIRLAEARRLIQTALAFEPENPYVLDSMGWVEYRQGNLAAAQRLLEQAYRIDADAEIAAHLGEVLWKRGERQQALKIWREGLADNAQSKSLLETIQRLDGADSALLLELPSRAEQDSADALKAKP